MITAALLRSAAIYCTAFGSSEQSTFKIKIKAVVLPIDVSIYNSGATQNKCGESFWEVSRRS